MRPVIPLVSRVAGEERKTWTEELPKALAHVAEVKLFEMLTPSEKAAADVAIVANPDPKDLVALPNLKWIQSLWAGVERMVAELPESDLKIVRLVDPQMAETMSEAVLAWTLYLHRDMPRYAVQQRQKVWYEYLLKTPAERTIGILGLGKLGATAALRLAANGFDVCGWSASPKQLDGIDTYHGPDGLDAVLGRADILVLLMPLTDDTRGLINADKLARLPRGAALINFARGPILDTDALRAALDRGALRHAVLDVFDQEPLPDSSPLWHHPAITVLPHISAPTILSSAARIVAANLETYLRSGAIPPSVDRRRGY